MQIRPQDAVFCLLSFEGPDRYSRAGGLGVRISHLAETLAGLQFDTHLLFVGDPSAPGRETCFGGRLTLHRWCQWISAFHGAGVYDGEEGKIQFVARTKGLRLTAHTIRTANGADQLALDLRPNRRGVTFERGQDRVVSTAK